MGGFILLILLFAVFVFFLGKLLVAYASRLTATFVGTRLEDAETIVQTGRVPITWLYSFPAKRRSNTRIGGEPEPRRMNKRMALKRLDRIVRYFEKTPFVENEQVRAQLLEQLDDAWERWQTATWEDMLPPDA